MLWKLLRSTKASKMDKTYTDLMNIPTYEGRINYLRTNSEVGGVTFGGKRCINQSFYRNNSKWKKVRSQIIVRDNGCDLGLEDRKIFDGDEIVVPVIVHHINPISYDDILNDSPKLYDPENLITVTEYTHRAIHYGKDIQEFKDRSPGDTDLWRSL